MEPNSAAPAPTHEALVVETTIENFQTIDLRVGIILQAAAVEGSEKLLQLRVGLGPLGDRTIFSGIAKSYPDPAALIGKVVTVFANLKPRKMRFGVSEGMLLAAGSEEAVTLVELATTATPGDRIG